MAYQIGSIVLSRGAIPPATIEHSSDQIVHKTEDGTVVVTEQLYGKESFVRFKVILPVAEAKEIETYLTEGLNFRSITTYVAFGIDAWTCRFWDTKVIKKVLRANRVEMDLLFRREI